MTIISPMDLWNPQYIYAENILIKTVKSNQRYLIYHNAQIFPQLKLFILINKFYWDRKTESEIRNNKILPSCSLEL